MVYTEPRSYSMETPESLDMSSFLGSFMLKMPYDGSIAHFVFNEDEDLMNVFIEENSVKRQLFSNLRVKFDESKEKFISGVKDGSLDVHFINYIFTHDEDAAARQLVSKLDQNMKDNLLVKLLAAGGVADFEKVFGGGAS